MFSGSWSTGSISTTPTSSGGGGWTTGSTLINSGGGWSTGTAPTSSSSGGGTWSFDSSSTQGSGGGTYAYTAPVYSSYNYQGSGGYYALPGAGLYAALPGEGGAYTPLDFPLMHELKPGERLEDANARGLFAKGSVLPYLALGVIAALLLKK